MHAHRPGFFASDRLSRILLLLSFSVMALCSFGHADDAVLKIGVYDNAPKIFMDESGKPAGMFVDIIEAVAAAEGWKLAYVHGTWAEGLDRLEHQRIDLMPDVAHTADREDRFSFHKVPVLSSWFQVYAHKGSGIHSILDLAGKRIAVLERSVQEQAFVHLSQGFDLRADLIALPDYRSTFERVASGGADAVITNRFYGLAHAKAFGLEDTAVVFSPSNLFFAAPKGQGAQLLAAIDRNLTHLKKNPKSVYYNALERWTSVPVRFSLPPWVRIVGMVAGIALVFSIVGGFVLKAKVNQRTRELNDMNSALHASEQKYRELVMLANSIIMRFSRDGRITFLNEFGQRFFGYSEKEIIGRSILETIIPEYDSSGKYLGSLMEEIFADPLIFEYNINENVRRNGERVWIDWRNKMVFDEHGQLKEILSIGSDITDRKLAEEEIRRLNDDLRRHADVLEKRVAERTAELVVARDRAESADRLKSAFLATMSHELRTPLNSIIGFTGILVQGLAGPLNEEQQKQMGMVQTSARHLLALINDVLDISKIEAGQLSLSIGTFELGDAARKAMQLVAPFAEKKGLELKLRIDDAVGTITTDQRRFEQILLNLLNNAVKFTDKGYVALSCRLDNAVYVISVEDTGIGMQPEEIPGLFQPFHQIDTGLARKHEGTGLGLSICKKLVDMMGGGIDVRSRLAEGSTFTVRVPKDGSTMEK